MLSLAGNKSRLGLNIWGVMKMSTEQNGDYLEKKKKEDPMKEQLLFGNGGSIDEKKRLKKKYSKRKLNE